MSKRVVFVHGTGASWARRLRHSSDLLWVAAECKRAFEEHALSLAAKAPAQRAKAVAALRKRSAYHRTLTRLVGGSAPPNQLMDAIVALPFQHFVTTNYDDGIQAAWTRVRGSAPLNVLHSRQTAEVQQFATTWNRADTESTCVHLYGLATAPETIVLTESDYQSLYFSGDLPDWLARLFAHSSLVFFGYSLDDVDLMQVLRRVRARQENRVPHFAILPLSDGDPPERSHIESEQLLAKYGITAIFYRKLTESFAGLEALLDLLTREVRTPKRAQRAQSFTFDKDLLRVPRFPDDPNKSLFGERAERNGRRLTATVRTHPDDRDWFEIVLEVTSTTRRPLRGGVSFYVHDSFPRRRYPGRANAAGSARLTLGAWGAFTVGVLCDGGRTALELDLADCERAPRDFRLR
jgi:hypothetical protein